MFRKNKQLKGVIYILIGIVFFGIWGELAGAEVTEPFQSLMKRWFPTHPYAGLMVLFGIMVLLTLVHLLADRIFDDDKTTGKVETDEDRHNLLKSLQKRYEVRLKKKMDTELNLAMELKLKYTKEGTSKEFIKEYFVDKYKEKLAGDFDTLFDHYTNKLKRLLIIGEPGAGKTVLLLNFALRLLNRALQDARYPIPIILNLSSWRDEEQAFETWVEKDLVFAAGQFGTSKEHARELIAGNNLLLLLDGLDEVPENHRDSCMERLFIYLQKLNRQRLHAYPEVIICSRREEYKQQKANAPVQAVVNIEPLTFPVIRKELNYMSEHMGVRGNAANKLRMKLDEHPHIVPLLTSAFYLHLALKQAGTDFDLGKIQHQKDLVRIYLYQQLDILGDKYRPDQSFGWLAWLADQLTAKGKGITFELVDLQPDWAKREWSYKALFAWVLGSIFGIMLGGAAGVKGVMLGSVMGILASLTSSKVTSDEIRTIDFKKFKIKYFFKLVVLGIFLSCLIGLVYGFSTGLRIGMSCGIIIGAIESAKVVRRNPTTYTSYKRLYAPFVLDLILFFIVCTTVLIGKPYLNLTVPGVIQPVIVIHPALWVIVVSFLMAILTGPLVNHFVLRLVLYTEGAIPLRFVTFLDTVASKTGLMERDGGKWRFRHQLIQDVFRESRH